MMKKIAVVHRGNSDNNKVLSFVVCIPLRVHEKGTQKAIYQQHSNLVFDKFLVFVQAFLNKHHNIYCQVFLSASSPCLFTDESRHKIT